MKPYITTIALGALLLVAPAASAELLIRAVDNAAVSPEVKIEGTDKEGYSLKVKADTSKEEKKEDEKKDDKEDDDAKKTSEKTWGNAEHEKAAAATRTEIKNNPRVTRADISENEVIVDYKVPARLLAVIPVTMTMTVKADAAGRTTVTFPWYKFITTSPFSMTAEILNSVLQGKDTPAPTATPADHQIAIFLKIASSLKAIQR